MDKSLIPKLALKTLTSNQNYNNINNKKEEEENTFISKQNDIINDDEAKKYFTINLKEENPKILDKWTNIRYYNLELIFNSFYPLTSLAIAKNTSKEERIARKIKDNSFTYGEIVFKFLYIILF
jgi:hypothetical protein